MTRARHHGLAAAAANDADAMGHDDSAFDLSFDGVDEMERLRTEQRRIWEQQHPAHEEALEAFLSLEDALRPCGAPPVPAQPPPALGIGRDSAGSARRHDGHDGDAGWANANRRPPSLFGSEPDEDLADLSYEGASALVNATVGAASAVSHGKDNEGDGDDGRGDDGDGDDGHGDDDGNSDGVLNPVVRRLFPKLVPLPSPAVPSVQRGASADLRPSRSDSARPATVERTAAKPAGRLSASLADVQLAIQRLRREEEQLEAKKATDLAEIETARQAASAALRRDKLRWEKERKAAHLPSKKDRLEIDLLRQQVADLQQECKAMTCRSQLQLSQLRRRLKTSDARIQELQEEVKCLERERAMRMAMNSPSGGSSSHDGGHAVALSASRSSSPTTASSPAFTSTRLSATGAHETTRSALTASTSFRASKAVTAAAVPVAGKTTWAPSARTSLSARTPSAMPGSNPDIADAAPMLDERQRLARMNAVAAELGLEHVQAERLTGEGHLERDYDGGATLTVFRNGTYKQTRRDGHQLVGFANGDVKRIAPDRTEYWYAATATRHESFRDGRQVYHFRNGQIECHMPDGLTDIVFADGTRKVTRPDGAVTSLFPNGTAQSITPDGVETIAFADGTREIYWKGFRQKVAPDGAVKTIYPNGFQEAVSVTGRVRYKDPAGQPIAALPSSVPALPHHL
ncbi:hypothetical protein CAUPRSCDRAFT_10647, partial [Caulochytrium protostelioides]